ncbi:DUF721 domain-containing protein [Rhodobacterales bacterium HKCCE3408]|nr:DUF721 domain-containing protein [Rhodobacterales bacterium HKCCE3408]
MSRRDPQDTPSHRPRRRGFEPASKLIGAELRSPMRKRGFAEAKLLTRWPEIVGSEIAELAVPVTLKHGQQMGGTLVLLTTGSAAPLVQMRAEEIKARVNACYGYRAVSRVSVTQTAASGFAEGQAEFAAKRKETRPAEPDPAAMNEAEAVIGRIGDERLRAALARMARRALVKPE